MPSCSSASRRSDIPSLPVPFLHRRTSKLARQALALLFAGAVINVIVAWALATSINPFSIQPMDGRHRWGERIDEQNRFWIASVMWRAGAAHLSAFTGKLREGDMNQGEHPDQLLPTWWRAGRFDGHPSEELWAKLADKEIYQLTMEELVQFQSHAEARGWPLPSMWYELQYWSNPGPRNQMKSLGGIALPLPVWIDPRPYSGKDQPRTLPLRPIWSGFAINTFFYAAILFLIFFVPAATRRMIRRRRGLCQKCAYPIGSSAVCTECGANVTVTVQRCQHRKQ
jgi:hypothetical protein